MRTEKFVKAFQKASRPKTQGYDTQAEVRRVEGGTAWVHIPGGVDETPVKLTIDAKAGDNVQVRVSGGKAFLVGNATAPPTDNTVANEANSKASFASEAIEEQQEHFWYDGLGAHIEGISSGYRNDLKSDGMYIVKNGVTVAKFGTETEIYTTDGTELVHFGYDSGTDSGGGTSVAPYYSLGTRASGSTVGNYSVAEGLNVTASGYASFAEGVYTVASGSDGTHAEGVETTASADFGAHAEGFRTVANGESSHAQNFGTIANKASQTAIGTYNVSDTSATTTHPSGGAEYGKYAFIIGNGTYGSRSNALTVDWSGNVSAAGQVKSKTETYGISLPSGVGAFTFKLVRNGGIAMLSIVNIQSLPAGNTTICTLSSGWRPASEVAHTFNAPAASSSSDLRVYITTAGVLSIYNYGSAITSPSNKSLTLCYVLA